MKGHQLITTQEVEPLLEKFMAGTTTLEEEAQLADFFRTHEVPGEWVAYKDMFALFDEGKVEPPSPQRGKADAKKSFSFPLRMPSPFWGWGAGIAAAVVLLLSLGFFLFHTNQPEKPELMAQTDTIKAAPLREEKQVEEQPPKPDEHKEQADSVNNVKEMQRIARPPKRYMAKVEKKDVQPEKKVSPDTIIFAAPPYYIASKELSEPEIQERTLRASAPQKQIDYEHLDYEEMKREIQLRGERLKDIGELAINNEEDF